jgi:MFS family permease
LITTLATGHGALILASANLPLLGGLLLLAGAAISPATGAIYALAGRAAPAGQRTEAFAWLLSANATGASVGATLAGSLSQTAGSRAAFALAAGAGALAVLIVSVGRDTLDAEPAPEPAAVARFGGGQATIPEPLAERGLT